MNNYYNNIFKISFILLVVFSFMFISALCEFSPKLNRTLNGQVLPVKSLPKEFKEEKLVGMNIISGDISDSISNRGMGNCFRLSPSMDGQ